MSPISSTAVARRRITVSTVRDAMRAVIDEYPRRTDRRAKDGLPARYIDRGQPNCLVALVLNRLGISVGVLKALDAEHPTGELVDAGVTIAESRHPALRRIDPVARQLLQHVQDLQDRGMRWDLIVNDAFTGSLFGRRFDKTKKPWLVTQ